MFVLDLAELRRQFPDAFSAGLVRHGACLERGLVLADLAADRVDLAFQPGEVFAVVFLGFRRSRLVGGDGGVEDRRVAVGPDESVEDGVLEGLRGQPVVVAAALAEALPVVADVVAVLAGSSVREGSGVGGVAAVADDAAGEFVLGGVRSAQAVISGSGVEGLRGLGERLAVDQRCVRGWVPGTVVVDLPGVDAVPEQGRDVAVGPESSVAGSQPLLVEMVRDRLAAETAPGVQVEDFLDDERLIGYGDEEELVLVHGVAVWRPAGVPSTLGGLRAQRLANPVDHRGAFELGEHAQNLHQHAPDVGGCVERLGGRSERDAGLVELVDDLAENP
nr:MULTISPECIES: hypothetical protein [Parafrankia]